MSSRDTVLDLEAAFRRCLSLSATPPALTLATKGYTLPDAAAALYVNLAYLKGVLRGTYRSPHLLRKIHALPNRKA